MSGSVISKKETGVSKESLGRAGPYAGPAVVLLVCLIVYFSLHFAYANRDDVFTTDGDEVHYLVSTESLISDHDLSPMNNYMQHVYMRHGYYQREIPVPMLVPGAGGRMVSNHLPLLPLLLVPGFSLLGYSGAAATMIILFSLGGLLTFLVLRRFTGDAAAVAVTLAFFLTYPAVTYSRLIYPETVAVFLVMLSVWASIRTAETEKRGYAVLAGLPAALLFQFHTKFIVISAALGFLAWACSRHRRRDMLAWSVPVVASLAILLWLTVYLYGTDIIHGLTVSAGPGDITGGQPFWGFFGLYLDRAWGLFIFAPLYFTFLPGVPLARGRRDLDRWWLFIPMVLLLHTAVAGFFGQWFGGTAPVPRYLVPLIPVFVLCAGLFFLRCRNAVVRAAAVLLLAWQAVLTVFSLLYPMKVFAIHGPNNALIPEVLGDNRLSRTLTRVFPLLHPVLFKSGILPLAAWLSVLAFISVYLRRKVMDPLYEGLELKF